MPELELLYQRTAKLLARVGVPDYHYLANLQPQLHQLHECLPHPQYLKIAACCGSATDKSKRCDEPICPRCSTLFRRPLALRASRYQYDERLRACLVTYVPRWAKARQGQLQTIDHQSILQNLKNAFAESWVAISSPIVVIGAPDVSLNESAKNLFAELKAAEKKRRHCWQVHFHFVIVGTNPESLADLLKTTVLGGRPPRKGEFQVKASLCTGRSIVYATKYQPVRRAIVLDHRGNYDRKERPLAVKPMTEALAWLSAMPLPERIFGFFQPGGES